MIAVIQVPHIVQYYLITASTGRTRELCKIYIYIIIYLIILKNENGKNYCLRAFLFPFFAPFPTFELFVLVQGQLVLAAQV